MNIRSDVCDIQRSTNSNKGHRPLTPQKIPQKLEPASLNIFKPLPTPRIFDPTPSPGVLDMVSAPHPPSPIIIGGLNLLWGQNLFLNLWGDKTLWGE